jgi:hypothetical protein
MELDYNLISSKGNEMSINYVDAKYLEDNVRAKIEQAIEGVLDQARKEIEAAGNTILVQNKDGSISEMKVKEISWTHDELWFTIPGFYSRSFSYYDLARRPQENEE